MANYTPTNLVKAQAKLMGMFAKGELRFRDPATHKEILRNSAIMFPDFSALRTREDRTVEAAYALRSSRSLGSARAHNHSGNKGDSAVLTPSWATKTDKFSLSLKQGDSNIFSNEEMMMAEIQNLIGNFANGLETSAVNFVFASRSGVNVATAEGSFNAANDTFEIAEAFNGGRAMQITKSAMVANKWTGALTIFCDEISYNKFQFQAAQGATNATNTSFQFTGVKFVYSVELTALAASLGYTKGFWVAAEDGTFGLLPWIPKQNREGRETKVNMYSSFLNPVDGLTLAVHSYEATGDQSAANGQTQDVLTQFEFSIDIADEYAPLSVANETPLQAFGLI